MTFGSGEVERTFTISAVADNIDDDDERVELSFGELPSGVTRGSVATTTVAILDDDDPQVVVSFEQDAYTVSEGSSVTVTVKLSADPERSVTIPLTKADQGGASNSDYSGVPANVTFNSGDTEKTFSFSAGIRRRGRRRGECGARPGGPAGEGECGHTEPGHHLDLR